jgi:UDP-glucose 4-epimerase
VRPIVTGGAGFIGSLVVDALVERGDAVLVLDDLSNGRRENVNQAAELVVVDIRDRERVAEVFAAHRPDVGFHLAAQADVRVSVDQRTTTAKRTARDDPPPGGGASDGT